MINKIYFFFNLGEKQLQFNAIFFLIYFHYLGFDFLFLNTYFNFSLI